jgi:hypothetical protein
MIEPHSWIIFEILAPDQEHSVEPFVRVLAIFVLRIKKIVDIKSGLRLDKNIKKLDVQKVLQKKEKKREGV